MLKVNWDYNYLKQNTNVSIAKVICGGKYNLYNYGRIAKRRPVNVHVDRKQNMMRRPSVNPSITQLICYYHCIHVGDACMLHYTVMPICYIT